MQWWLPVTHPVTVVVLSRHVHLVNEASYLLVAFLEPENHWPRSHYIELNGQGDMPKAAAIGEFDQHLDQRAEYGGRDALAIERQSDTAAQYLSEDGIEAFRTLAATAWVARNPLLELIFFRRLLIADFFSVTACQFYSPFPRDDR
jgi:hypothetical protein